MKKNKTVLRILLGLLWFTAIADTLTFLLGNKHQFEINPLYILTKSVPLLLFVKFAIIGGLSYSLTFYEAKKTYMVTYLLVFVCLCAILGQGLGAYSNIHTVTEYKATVGTSQEIQPMQPSEAVKTFAYLSFVLMYAPMFLAVLTFILWERLYCIKPKVKDETKRKKN